MKSTLLFAIASAMFSSAVLGYDYFEHRFVGDMAFSRALSTTPLDHPLRTVLNKAYARLGLGSGQARDRLSDRALKQVPLTFGDLAALAGDLADDPAFLRATLEGLQSAKHTQSEEIIVATRQQWLSACRWFHSSYGREDTNLDVTLDGCFRATMDVKLPTDTAFFPLGSPGYKPPPEEQAAFERLPRFTKLASENRSHFPRYSWHAYVKHHSSAIKLAICFQERRTNCTDSSGAVATGDDLVAAALVEEGFAQHYLHDSFAAGHIGSQFEGPTKRRLQQTHDVLNRIGLDVDFPSSMPPAPAISMVGGLSVSGGWTAFGDDHLFIPEASVHRAILIAVADQSVREVLDATTVPSAESDRSGCSAGVSQWFPVVRDRAYLSEQTLDLIRGGNVDLCQSLRSPGSLVRFAPLGYLEQRSKDPRVPSVPAEGWKVGLGLIGLYKTKDHVGEAGSMFGLDYTRSFDPVKPNTWGVELWNVPNLSTSVLLSFGYSFPREYSRFSWAMKAKIGFRTDENFTAFNPSSARRNRVEVLVPVLEAAYEFYPPVAIFFQYHPFATLFRHKDFELEGIEVVRALVGVRLDLSDLR